MNATVRCLIVALLSISWPGAALPGSNTAAPAKGLTAFTSEEELASYLAKLKPLYEVAAAAAGDELDRSLSPAAGSNRSPTCRPWE